MAAVLNDQSGDFRVAMDDPYDLILGMFALAVTAVMVVAGPALPRDKARATGNLLTAGLDSNIIDPVALGCLHARAETPRPNLSQKS